MPIYQSPSRSASPDDQLGLGKTTDINRLTPGMSLFFLSICSKLHKVRMWTDLIIPLKFKNATKQNLRRPAHEGDLHPHKRGQVPGRTPSPRQAISHLSYELQFCPRSRSMSLLAYCYYMSQDFLNSARVYEQLSKFYPEVTEYKLYLAQSHYKNGDLEQALKVSQSISDPASSQKVILLQSLIRYEQDEIQHAKALLRQGTPASI
jgi:tetratricopeptide (TPR) repeat protein